MSLLGAVVQQEYFATPAGDELELDPSPAEEFPVAIEYRRFEESLRAVPRQEKDLKDRWLSVLENWHSRRERGPDALQLARIGVPPSLRGLIWLCAIGNTARAGALLYSACLERAAGIFGAVAVCGGRLSPPLSPQNESKVALRAVPGAGASAERALPGLPPRGRGASGDSDGGAAPLILALEPADSSLGCPSAVSPGGDGLPGSSAVEAPRLADSRASSGDTGGLSANERRLPQSPCMVGLESTFLAVGADLSRTFPDLAFFSEGSATLEQLARVLAALAVHRPDVGYVQGFSHLAAMLVLTVGSALPPPSLADFPSLPHRHDRRRRSSVVECTILDPEPSATEQRRRLSRDSEALLSKGQGVSDGCARPAGVSDRSEPEARTGGVAFVVRLSTDVDLFEAHNESKSDAQSSHTASENPTVGPPPQALPGLASVPTLASTVAAFAPALLSTVGPPSSPPGDAAAVLQTASSAAAGAPGGGWGGLIHALFYSAGGEGLPVSAEQSPSAPAAAALPTVVPGHEGDAPPLRRVEAAPALDVERESARIGAVRARMLPAWGQGSVLRRSRATEDACGDNSAESESGGPEEALVFACLANLILTLPPLRWYAMRDAAALGAWARLVDACLAASVPSVAASLSEHGITADLYLPAWVLTLFARPLGVEAAAPLWDRCVLGGAPEVLRCVLGIVRHLDPLLAAAGSFEGCLGVLARVPACARGPLGVAAAVDGTPLPAEAADLLAELDAGAL